MIIILLSPENPDGKCLPSSHPTCRFTEELECCIKQNAYSCRPCNVIIARAADARSW